MNALPVHPRPRWLIAIAALVLLAHAALLGWMARRPGYQLNLRETMSVRWIAAPQPQAVPPIPTPAPDEAAPRTPVQANPAPQSTPRQPIPRPRLQRPRPEPAQQAAAHQPVRAPTPPARPPVAAQRSQADEAPTQASPTPSGAPSSPAPAAPSEKFAPTATAPASSAPVMAVGPSYKAAYLDNPPPPYPRLSRQLGEEGTALLRVEVGPDGTPLQVRLQTSSGYSRLDEVALTTVAQWRFAPATRNGEPITAWVLVPVRFRILN